MKRQISKLDDFIHLDNPVLIESKTSFIMQFFFYFLFLILGVSGIYGCFYTTFSLSLSLKLFILYAIVFCAVFTIAFLIKFNRILLLVLSLTAVLFVLFLIRTKDILINYLTQGFFLTYNSVILEYAQKTQYNLFTFPTSLAGQNEITASVTIFAVFTLFFFTFFMAWLIIRRKNTFLSFILTTPFLILSLFLNIIPHYTAVGALYVFWAFLIFNSLFLQNKSKFNKKKGVFYSGGNAAANPQLLILLPILVACLMLVTALFPIKSFKRSDAIDDIRISLLNVPKIPSPIQIPIQSILGYNDRVNLQLVGNITFTGKTVLRVKSSSNEGDYLKGFVGSIYTGQSWEPLPEKEYEKLDSILNEWKVQNFTSLYNKLLGRPIRIYDLNIQNVKRNSLRIYSPYGLISKPEELPNIDFINDGFLGSSNALFGTSEYSLKATSLQIYTWTLSESLMEAFISDQPSFIQAAKKYNNFVYSNYTQLPEALKEELDQYRHEHNLYIERYLSPNAFANEIISKVQSQNTYTLSPGVTPEGRDFVEYFLFENHKGYCVHFASAAVALLRSAGVPARYVEGYAISPNDFESHDEWADIPDSRSHAWVEIYLKTIGWVPIEATPGAQSGIINHEAAESETSSNQLEEEITDDPQNIQEPVDTEDLPDEEDSELGLTETQSLTASPLTNTIISISQVLSVFALPITALLINRKLQISLRNKKFTQQDNNKAALAIYDYIEKLYDYAKPNKTADCSLPKDLYDLVLKARFSQHMLKENELEKLLIYAKKQVIEIQTSLTLIKRFIGRYIYVLF